LSIGSFLSGRLFPGSGTLHTVRGPRRLQSKNKLVNRVSWLRDELVLLQQQRRDLTVRDQAAVAEIRAVFKARLAAARLHT